LQPNTPTCRRLTVTPFCYLYGSWSCTGLNWNIGYTLTFTGDISSLALSHNSLGASSLSINRVSWPYRWTIRVYNASPVSQQSTKPACFVPPSRVDLFHHTSRNTHSCDHEYYALGYLSGTNTDPPIGRAPRSDSHAVSHAKFGQELELSLASVDGSNGYVM